MSQGQFKVDLRKNVLTAFANEVIRAEIDQDILSQFSLLAEFSLKKFQGKTKIQESFYLWGILPLNFNVV